MLIALDTETTGHDLQHGCKPFFVSTVDEKGKIVCWEWDVDPMTREPQIPSKDKAALRKLVAGPLVLHNIKFDVRALEVIGVKFDAWDQAEDTLVASHCLASSEPHGLKFLADEYLGIDDGDQQDLRDATNEARRIGRKLGWRIAQPFDPHFPAVKRAPKAGWWVMDTWLPRAVAKAEGYAPDHPWHSVLGTYAKLDVERTLGLWWMFHEALKDEGLMDVYRTRMKVLPALYAMEKRGASLSSKRLDAAIESFTMEAADAEYRAKKYAESKIDNLASPKQMQGVLYGHFKFKPVKETKTGYSTDASTLEILQDQARPTSKGCRFIQNVVAHRKNRKAVDYLESYKLSGVGNRKNWLTLHPSFNLTGTASTRNSSQDPNAQNISKQESFNLRQVFGPMPGRHWLAMDYQNIELRIFAYESGDRELIEAFEAGYSVHLIIAEALRPAEFKRLGPEAFAKTEAYRWTKAGNFSLIYGASPRKADATYRVDGAYDRIRSRFPEIDRFMSSKYAEGMKRGFVTTLGGYRLQVPHDRPHVAVNYFVQGSAGWAMNKAIIRTHEYLSKRKDHHAIMTIHDELVFDFPNPIRKPVVRACKRLMEKSGEDLGLPTPVDADLIDDNWANGKGMKL